MKSVKYVSALFALWASSQALAISQVSATPGGPQFCMQNYNAYGPLYAPDTKERMDWIGSLLQAFPRCSVVHLQEVWSGSNIDQIEQSLQRLYSISAPNRDERIGVMSMFDAEIKSRYTQAFKVNNEGGVLDKVRQILNVKKAFHVVRAQLFDMGEDFYFINTHLHPTSEAVRLTQVLDILEWRLQNQDLKVLMSGDFNADEKSFERDFLMSVMGMHDSLLDTFNGTYPKGLCTYCSSNPHSWMLDSHILDYIFVSNVGGNETHLKALYGEVNMRGPLRTPLSDHYGLRVQFELQPGRNEITDQQATLRKQALLKVLDQAYELLSVQKEADFAAYAVRVQDLKRQILKGTGEFNQYIKKFN